MKPEVQAWINKIAEWAKNLATYIRTNNKLPDTITPLPVLEATEAPKSPTEPLSLTLADIIATYQTGWGQGDILVRRNLYIKAQQIAKDEGLSISKTADMLATIWGESGWNPYCINYKTKDYGLCQFSALYYLKEYKMTPEQAILNPEKCLHIMAYNFAHGRESNWVAYSNGSYKTYLNKPVT